MIKVVIISEFSGGGVERVNTQLASYLDKSLFEVSFVSLVTDPKAVQIPNDFKCFCLNATSKKSAGADLFRTLMRINPDIILSSCLVETYFAYLYKRIVNHRVKLVYAQHSVWSQCMNTRKAIVMNKYMPKITGIFNKLDALVFVSKGVKTDFLKTAGQTTTENVVIYNPVANGKEKFEYRPIDKKSISIVTAGRIEEEKCQKDMIKALSILIKQGQRCDLTIFGEGSLKEPLIEYAKQLGILEMVFFPGFVSDIQVQMKDKDIFVLSSIYESFGNVLVEAMNVGLPVVSTDCPVGPKEILSNGKFGVLVPIHDSDKLASAILETISEDTKIRRENAYYRSLDFSVEKSIHDYEKLFFRLMDKN